MNKRIRKLREQSLNAVNRISAERALLVTEFYQQYADMRLSPAMRRAMCFEYILRNKEICINDGELIVGERGPSPKATPTYPEISIHTVKDLDILDSREKVSFKVDEKTRIAYRDKIIPFWTGNSNRDRIMSQLPEVWKKAYAAGVFTEFQEQRAPGHTVCGDKIYHKGMLDIIIDINSSIDQLDFFEDPRAYEKREELRAMEVVAGAIIMFAERHAERLEQLMKEENDAGRKKINKRSDRI